MSCQRCRTDIFKQKLGRCTRCIKQLIFLAIGGWFTWLEFFQATPYRIEAIATLIISILFSSLLILHLFMMGYYRLTTKNTRQNK